MGTQRLPHPFRCTRAPLRIAVLLLLSLQAFAPAQTTTTSAFTVPLLLPSAIVFDTTGNLYLAETANHVIRKVDTSGVLTTIAGSGNQGFSGDNGPATAALLDSPQGLALDTANNLYIADTHNHRIRKLNLATNVVVTIAGTGVPGFSGDNAPATAANLDLPTALALDLAGDLYLADTANHRIRRIDAHTGIISTIAGNGIQGFSGDNGAATAASIDSPTGIAATSSTLFLADTHNHRIRTVNLPTGIITTLAGKGGLGFSGDNAPASTATLALPHGLTVDASGNLYLSDTANNRIRRIDASTGAISTIAGSGAQSFSGDGGPAIAAALDTPRAVSLAPTGLLTLADTGNQRIRQLDSAPAPAAIHTLAGLGVTTPGALTLVAPSIIAYGSGQVIAALATSSPATGNIVFLNTANALSSTLGSEPLIGNVASLPASTLSAGFYNITATYSGDQTHSSAQSPAVVFRIAPQLLTVSITSATSTTYGQPVPILMGSIAGVLRQDTGNVTASYSSAASTLSSAGVYPITATLSGLAAGNYAVAPIAYNLTINPATTITAFSNLIATGAPGTALTFATQVGTTSSGLPTGTVTLLDDSTQLGMATLSTTGLATFRNIILAAGTHTLSAVYNGSINFAPSTSSLQQVTISLTSTPNPPPTTYDFTLAATGASTQTIFSGAAANFTFTVQPQGNMSSPVTLAATGLPNLAIASFNPPTIPPAFASTPFTLTIATPQTTARNRTAPPSRRTPAWALLALPILGFAFRRRTSPAKLLTRALLAAALVSTSGCGNRVNVASLASGAAAKTYTIVVTGTSTTSTGSTLQHSTAVTLILQPPS